MKLKMNKKYHIFLTLLSVMHFCKNKICSIVTSTCASNTFNSSNFHSGHNSKLSYRKFKCSTATPGNKGHLTKNSHFHDLPQPTVVSRFDCISIEN